MNGIKIVVDGQVFQPTDANGNTVEPLIYNGTTYLPVRSVADALGKAVYWDGPNYTVYLGNMDGGLEYPTVELGDMVSINQTPLDADELTDNYGNRYSGAVYNGGWNHYHYEYLLNMKYNRFKASLYVPQGITDDSCGNLIVKTDGKTVYTSPEMSKTSHPVYVDVNVSGCNDIEIILGENGGGNLCLANAGFYQ